MVHLAHMRPGDFTDLRTLSSFFFFLSFSTGYERKFNCSFILGGLCLAIKHCDRFFSPFVYVGKLRKLTKWIVFVVCLFVFSCSTAYERKVNRFITMGTLLLITKIIVKFLCVEIKKQAKE